MIDYIAVFILGTIFGAGLTGLYVHHKYRKIKKEMSTVFELP